MTPDTLKNATQLLLQKGGVAGKEAVFEKTPLGKRTTAHGGGKAPVWNPGDGTITGEGSSAKGGTPDAIKKKLQQLGGLGGGIEGEGGFEVDAGSPGEQVRDKAKKGGGAGGDDDDKGNTGRGSGFFGDPELVDPLGPPIAKILRARMFVNGRKIRVVLYTDAAVDGGPRLSDLPGPSGGPGTIGLGGPDTKGQGGQTPMAPTAPTAPTAPPTTPTPPAAAAPPTAPPPPAVTPPPGTGSPVAPPAAPPPTRGK